MGGQIAVRVPGAGARCVITRHADDLHACCLAQASRKQQRGLVVAIDSVQRWPGRCSSACVQRVGVQAAWLRRGGAPAAGTTVSGRVLKCALTRTV
jgi:hypothetical protein